jgi:predicted DNA-binding WGR domain protein
MNTKQIYLGLADKKPHKFYELGLDKNIIRINYGRIGRTGKIKTVPFKSAEESAKFFNKQYLIKQRMGYY